MSIRKIKLNTGDVYEVDLYFDGRGSSRIRRRFKKKIDAQAFIQNYQTETLQFKRTGGVYFKRDLSSLWTFDLRALYRCLFDNFSKGAKEEISFGE